MISFIIPTLNEEKVIKQTLDRLASYSDPHEIIISDGKSNDATIEIARKFTDKIVEYTGTLRQTIAGGKNMGAERATGDILVFLDADVSVLEPTAFFREIEKLFTNDSLLVAVNVPIHVLPELETPFDWIIFRIISLLYFITNNILKTGGASGEFQVIRREAFEKINGFDEKLAVCEDQDIFKRLAKIGRVYFAYKLLVYHTGRRAHRLGWPKLLFQWLHNFFSYTFFKKSAHNVWEEVR